MRGYVRYWILAVLTGLFGLVVSSDVYLSLLHGETYYKPVADRLFDAANAGSSLRVPIEPRRHDAYDVHLEAVTDGVVSYSGNPVGGEVKVCIRISGRDVDCKNVILDSAYDSRPSEGVLHILLDTVALQGVPLDDRVGLELEVVRPIDAWKAYSGHIRCKVAPGYSPK